MRWKQSTPQYRRGNRGSEELTDQRKSAGRGHGHITATGYLTPCHTHPVCLPNLAPQSQQTGNRAQQRPAGLPQPWTRYNCHLTPRPQTRRGRVPTSRPAPAPSPWPFCPRSAGACCRCCRGWRGSRSGTCFWTSLSCVAFSLAAQEPT